MTTPNDQQQRLITGIDGIYKVDAGAGTGKTFTITRRYAHILQATDVEPEDILLTTFTENGAATMRERIINHCDYDMAALRDAPIATFHSFCHDLLLEHGGDAPQLLGVDDRITDSTTIVENRFLEEREFRRFYRRFRRENGSYSDLYRIIEKPAQLLELIKSLCSKGVFPTADGWFRSSDELLDGDQEAFLDLFAEANEPNEGSRGKTNSDLKNRLARYDNKLHTRDAPSRADIRAGENTVPDHFGPEAFEEDRERLQQFVHDLYLGYIRYALNQNMLNFQFVLMFAYVLLVEDHRLRARQRFEYVMLDEFQDTNEIQFKLALLLAEDGNIAAVGDWKQSIFSFQYASVDNILSFRDRLQRYHEDLNDDHERINYAVDDVTEIDLTMNYRSSQQILDLAEHALGLEATYRESIDTAAVIENLTSLEAAQDTDGTRIAAFTSDEEHLAVLERIQQIVDNEAYTSDGETLDYSDVTVLVRRREAGRELQQLAREYNLPAAFEGGIELFSTDPAVLLLAWLRILTWGDSRRGWAVVLDEAGYTIEEMEEMLDAGQYPSQMEAFRDELDEQERIGGIAQHVFARYGLDNGVTARIIDVLEEVTATGRMDPAAVVRFIEQAIEDGTTYDIDDGTDTDAVTIQTIHNAKGTEYPAVIVADMNSRHFPSTQTSRLPIDYLQPAGLRQRRVWSDEPVPYTYDNWHTTVIDAVLAGEYDEERRLLYVAMTRAAKYLFLSAETGNESRFFTGLPLEPETVEPALEPLEREEPTAASIDYSPVATHTPKKLSAHAVMADTGPTDGDEGKGKAFGERVHSFAEAYIDGGSTEHGDEPDYSNVASFLDSLGGDLVAEQTVLLPLDGKRRYVLEGVIDLLHVTENSVEVIDFKTDRTRERSEEYRKQVSVYMHAIKELFDGRTVNGTLFYTENGEKMAVDPVSREELLERLQQ